MATRYLYLPYPETYGIEAADDKPATAETFFELLYVNTPLDLLPRPSLADALASPTVSKARDVMAHVIETHTSIDLEELYKIYSEVRKGEKWVTNLKRKKNPEQHFRQAWANAIRTERDFWCDLFIVAVWTLFTKTIVVLVNKDLKFIYHICCRDAPDRPEDDNTMAWRCLYLMLESPTSGRVHACNLTNNVDPETANAGALFRHKGNEKEWPQLLKRLDSDDWCLEDDESAKKQALGASRLTRGVDRKTGQIQEKTATASDLPQGADDDMVINPLTKRKVKVGSKTYLALVQAGTITTK